MAYILAMNPANRLRELRKKAGLTQAELADLTGVSQPAISQLENDTRPLDLDDMRALARHLGCRPVDLLSDQDNPDRLTDEERDMIARMRAAGPEQREQILKVADVIAPFHPAESEDERLQPRRVA